MGRGGEWDVVLGDEGAGEGTMLLRRRGPARSVHKQRGEGEGDTNREADDNRKQKQKTGQTEHGREERDKKTTEPGVSGRTAQ